jgi:hypothetical protein
MTLMAVTRGRAGPVERAMAGLLSQGVVVGGADGVRPEL